MIGSLRSRKRGLKTDQRRPERFEEKSKKLHLLLWKHCKRSAREMIRLGRKSESRAALTSSTSFFYSHLEPS